MNRMMKRLRHVGYVVEDLEKSVGMFTYLFDLDEDDVTYVSPDETGGQVAFAFIALGGTAPYGSAKHAVLGLTESLHEELKPLGVKVIAAMPGGFRSHFWNEGSNTIREGLDDIYGKYPAGQIRARTQEHAGNEMGDPAKLASVLIELASHDDPPLFLMLGGDALEYASQKRDSLVAELEAYQAVGRATAFDS